MQFSPKNSHKYYRNFKVVLQKMHDIIFLKYKFFYFTVK